MKMKNNPFIGILLIAGILLLANVLSRQFFLRWDLSENKQYTLNKATRDILGGLEEPVTVTAYFSEDLPPDFAAIRREFQDMLIEYANISRAYVNYEFINPESDDEKREALQNGIQPLLINVSEKDQVKQQQAFMGAVLQMGETQDVIPFVSPDLPMEYALSSSIKKLSVPDKPPVGLLQGHGEISLSQLGQAYQELSILYSVENIDLDNEEDISERFRTVAIVSPTDSFPPGHLDKLDRYLAAGGKLFIALNRVDGDLNNARGTEVSTGLEGWLSDKGLQVGPEFIIDEQCGSVTVQQRQGMFTIASQIQFPYLPLVTNFAAHPITSGLEQVILPFASPIRYTGDSSLIFTPITWTSRRSVLPSAPTFFGVDRQRTVADFPESNLTVGAILEGPLSGERNSAIVLFGDGDFPAGAQSEDNISLMVNSIDWLSDDTGLIALRTKGIESRPIDQEYLGEEGESKRAFVKYLNFGLPIILVFALGLFRYQRQRNLRYKRMQERYV